MLRIRPDGVRLDAARREVVVGPAELQPKAARALDFDVPK
jgi:hypothetical protein